MEALEVLRDRVKSLEQVYWGCFKDPCGTTLELEYWSAELDDAENALDEAIEAEVIKSGKTMKSMIGRM